MAQFYERVNKLRFDEEPPYSELKDLFLNQLHVLGYKDITQVKWDWLEQKETILRAKLQKE